MVNGEYQALKAALEWHLDAGADFAFADEAGSILESGNKIEESKPDSIPTIVAVAVPFGASEARVEALRLAQSAKNLDELRQAIAGFDGIGLKQTATNMVFADGNPSAPIMVVGEAPGADEDRLGKPFVGVSGQLLDRILSHVGLNRVDSDVARAIYISNILNWRPPGNRTPTPSEIEISLPFIERHIQLVQPKILIFAGGVAAQGLLGSAETISKLRGRFHDYRPRTTELAVEGNAAIPALATYHPSYLLRTPAQKKLVWADMLMLLDKRRDLGLIT